MNGTWHHKPKLRRKILNWSVCAAVAAGALLAEPISTLAVAFNKYEVFSEDLAEKVHNLDTDQLNIALSNSAPNAATHTQRSDITELATGGGYTQDTHDTVNSTSRSGGTTSVLGTDVVITGSGGGFGPFRYAILYNTTSTNDKLIGWWDYGSSISILAAETFTVDFGSSMFTVA